MLVAILMIGCSAKVEMKVESKVSDKTRTQKWACQVLEDTKADKVVWKKALDREKFTTHVNGEFLQLDDSDLTLYLGPMNNDTRLDIDGDCVEELFKHLEVKLDGQAEIRRKQLIDKFLDSVED